MNTQIDTTTDASTLGTTASAVREPKTATITLTANGTTLSLRAHRLRDGAETFVTTTDAEKKTTRGMTETHATFEAAKAAIAVSAAKAEKLGWVRRVAGRGFVAKPDAFSALPAAPKAAPKAKK